jgi:hypothetical protein
MTIGREVRRAISKEASDTVTIRLHERIDD